MAIIARIKIWLPGDILYASDLNGEFNNILNDYNGNITSPNLGALSYVPFSGSITFRQSGTDYFKIGGAGIVFGGALHGGWVCNLGLSYSAGTLTVVGADGAALSSANPGFLTTPSTGSTLQVIRVTAGPVLQDDAHATSHMTGVGFGITESVAYGSSMPFFLYVAVKGATDVDGVDGNSAIFISRRPDLTTTPSSTNSIATSTSAPTTDDQNAILLLGNFTKSNYTSVACVPLGVVRATWSAANTDWTIAALAWPDGVGRWSLEAAYKDQWDVPASQFGAYTTHAVHLKANGGVPPQLSSQSFRYRLSRSPNVVLSYIASGDGGTDGSGAVQAQLALPFVAATALSGIPCGYAVGQTTIPSGTPVFADTAAASNSLGLSYQSGAGTMSTITNAMFSAGNRIINVLATIPLLS